MINRIYIGRNYQKNLEGTPTKRLLEGWKHRNVAKRKLKVVSHDIKKIQQGNLNKEDGVTVDLIKSTKLKKISFLDVGCGIGKYAEICDVILPELDITYTGVDYSKDLIYLAKKHLKKENRKFYVGDALNLPFKDNSFDVLCASRIIPYCSDYIRAVKELSRVARRFVIIATTVVTSGKDVWQKQGAYGSIWASLVINEEKLKKVFSSNKLKIVKTINLGPDQKEFFKKSYLLKVMK